MPEAAPQQVRLDTAPGERGGKGQEIVEHSKQASEPAVTWTCCPSQTVQAMYIQKTESTHTQKLRNSIS